MIFHYTSQEGFKGIIQEDGIHLWFSDVRYMNDRDELENARRFFLQVVKDLFDEGDINEKIYEILKEVVCKSRNFSNTKKMYRILGPGKIEFKREREEGEFNKYICCFSQEQDSLPMWGHYLKNDNSGYAIGFDFENLMVKEFGIVRKVADSNRIARNDERKVQNEEIYGPLDITYDDVEKVRDFRESIITFAKEISRNDDAEHKNQCVIALQEWFENMASYFKDYHFAYEKEERLVICIKSLDNPGVDINQREEIRHRFVHGLVIPYIEVRIPNKKILKAVTISPQIGLNSEEKLLIESVKEYLKYLGYTHEIDIRCSEIPLRYY